MSEAGLLTGGQSRRHLGRARRHSATGHVRITCEENGAIRTARKDRRRHRYSIYGEGKQVLCSGVAT